MRNVWRILTVQLSGMLGVGRFFHTRDRAQRMRMGLLALSLLLGAGGMAATIYLLCRQVLPALRLLGLMNLLPALLFAASSILCLGTSLFTGASALFDTRDVQILLPMPLHARTIVCARLLGLYLIDLLVSLLVFAPAVAAYARLAAAPLPRLLAASVLGLLSLPVLPLLIGTALGTLIHAVSARSRYRNVVAIVLLCALTIGALAFSLSLSFHAESLDWHALLRLSQTMTDVLVRMYPPTRLFMRGIDGNVNAALLLLGLSAALFAAAVYLLGRFFMPLHALIGASPATRRRVGKDAWRVHSPFAALVAREARRMLASPVYAVNTLVGVLMMLLMSAALWIGGDRIWTLLSMGEWAGVDLRAYAASGAAYLLFLFTAMMPTTCASISLEGKSFPLLCSLPVRARTLFAAKAAFNMLILVPAALLSAVLTALALDMNRAQAAACFLLPLSGAFLAPAWGLIANLLFPRFDWKSEAEVVKQGLSPLVCMLGGMVLSIVPAVLMVRCGVDLGVAALALTPVYTALGAACWVLLLVWGEKRWERIG